MEQRIIFMKRLLLYCTKYKKRGGNMYSRAGLSAGISPSSPPVPSAS